MSYEDIVREEASALLRSADALDRGAPIARSRPPLYTLSLITLEVMMVVANASRSTTTWWCGQSAAPTSARDATSGRSAAATVRLYRQTGAGSATTRRMSWEEELFYSVRGWGDIPNSR